MLASLVVKGRDVTYSNREVHKQDKIKHYINSSRGSQKTYNLDLKLFEPSIKKKTRNKVSKEFNSESIKPVNLEITQKEEISDNQNDVHQGFRRKYILRKVIIYFYLWKL